MRTSKTIKAAKLGYIITSLFFCGAGILLMIWPGLSAEIICKVMGSLLLICGIIKIIGYFSRDLYRLAFQFDLAFGLLSSALGLVMLFDTDGMIAILHFIIGILALADGLFKIQTTVDAKKFGITKWWVIGLTSAATVIFGLILILKPFTGAAVLMTLTGITLLAEGVLNLCVALCAVKIMKNRKTDMRIVESYGNYLDEEEERL